MKNVHRGPFSVTLTVRVVPREKIWFTLPFLWRSLHFPQRNRWYGHNELCALLELTFSFRSNMSSECFLFTNFTITQLFSLVLFLPNSKRWQPSRSLDTMTISESFHIPITFCSRSLSETSFKMDDISILFFLLYCSAFACNNSKVVIRFSRLNLMLLTIYRSLAIFSSVSITSLKILPFVFSIWSTRSLFFMALMSSYDNSKKFISILSVPKV